MGGRGERGAQTVHPSVAGALLATVDPGRWMPNAYIQAVAHRGTSISPDEGRTAYQLDAADITGRIEQQVIEALVSAVAHRDYAIYGAALEGRGLTKTAVQGAAQIHERLGVLVEVAALSVVAVASASRLDDAAFLSKRRDAAGKAGACLARIECSSRARVTSPPSAASPRPTISSARVDRSLQRTAWPGADRARAAKDRPSGFAIPRGQRQEQQPLVGMAITARCPLCSPGPGGREQLWIRRQELGDPPATGEAALLGESVQIHRPVMHGRFGKRQGAMAHFAPESAPPGYETTWPSDRRSADPLSKTERTP